MDFKSKIFINNDFYLITINVFIKKGWALPLKNKKGESVFKELRKIIEEHQPKKLHADQGNEFLNKYGESYLEKMNIKLYFTNSELKAAIVERFNRTLKDKCGATLKKMVTIDGLILLAI